MNTPVYRVTVEGSQELLELVRLAQEDLIDAGSIEHLEFVVLDDAPLSVKVELESPDS